MSQKEYLLHFVLDSESDVRMPIGARITQMTGMLASNGAAIVMQAEVDDAAPIAYRRFTVRTDESAAELGDNASLVGSVQMSDSTLPVQVYEIEVA